MQSRRASTKSKQAQNTSTQNTGRGIGLGIWFFNFILNVKTELPHTSKVNQSFCHKCYQGGKKVRLPGPDLPSPPHFPSLHSSCTVAKHTLLSGIRCPSFSLAPLPLKSTTIGKGNRSIGVSGCIPAPLLLT